MADLAVDHMISPAAQTSVGHYCCSKTSVFLIWQFDVFGLADPSGPGPFWPENDEVEWRMLLLQGLAHCAFLWGGKINCFGNVEKSTYTIYLEKI